MQRKYFGTDGIRGQVGTGPINPEFIMKLGWAAGRVLGRGGAGKVLIGKDTRISGYMFESALESGLSAAGMDIRLLGPLPTPGIAYLTRSTRAVAGIVISASHNPFADNGVKFFSAEGCKLPDDVELAIEAEFELPMAIVESAKLGKAKRIDDAPRRYMEFCKGSVALDFNLAGVKIVLDCANGATYHIAPELFEELGATVISIADDPDGLNINDNCGATSPQALQHAVLKHQADVGIAFDGDGDRVLMVDADGDILDGDELLYIMAVDDPQALRGAVVGTQMSNLGLEQAVRTLGLNFLRTNVGDRYIYEAMCQHGLVLGGETSGHILRLDLTTTGDGIISALQVLGVMQRQQRTLHELKSGMQKFPQVLVNVRLTHQVNGHAGSHNSVMELPVVLAAVSEAEKTLGKTGRVLLRPSGTEPLLRIMVEGEQAAQVQLLSEQLADVVRHEVNAS